MARTWRAGVVGCGFFAQNHLHAWGDIDRVELAAVCDQDGAKAAAAAARFGIARHYDDAAKMLAAEDLDFVDLVTTMPTHRGLVELAARHKLPMIVQKPFAPTIEDCRAMVAAADAAGVPLMVHENFRFQKPIREAKAVLASGRIGRPFFARISWRTAYDVYANQPYLAAETRFIILDLVIHLFDVARYLFGEADRATCRTASVKPGIKGEDSAVILLAQEDGMTTVVDATYNGKVPDDPFPETLIEIDGALGSIRLKKGFELVITDANGIERLDVEPDLLPWAAKLWHPVQDSVLQTQRHWIDCLERGVEPATSGADNLKTYALCEAAYLSAATGETVRPEV
jgi:predicted dehydrogenase